MLICGLQKLTLLDYPEKVAATVFTGGCNFRCPFCHNAVLVLETQNCQSLAESDVLSFLKKRQGVLDGICLTGGEPLFQEDVADFLHEVKKLGYLVKIDTNGSFPHRLKQLIDAELVDYVAMDIKNSLPKYPLTCGLSCMDIGLIKESVDILMSGEIPYEFRTTLVREFHEEADLLAIGEWLHGAKKYYLQAFVDSGKLIQDGLHGFSKQEAQAFVEKISGYFDMVGIRGF